MLSKLGTLFMFAVLLFISSCSKDDEPTPAGESVRYVDELFTEVTVTSNVVYGSNVTIGGNSKNLLVDIYEPAGDTETDRPLIILAHGGGFTTGTKEDMAPIAKAFAKTGYVVASISYRLFDVFSVDLNLLRQEVWMATSDMKSAIRFFRKDAATDDVYDINTNRIIVGGVSAGAFMALNSAYVNDTAEVMLAGGTALADYIAETGGLEGNSGNDGYSSSVSGVFNVVGAMAKADIISAGEVPLFSIHGTADTVVPYLEGEANGTGVVTQGSGLLHPRATAVGVTNELITIEGGGHGVLGTTDCSTCLASALAFLKDI